MRNTVAAIATAASLAFAGAASAQGAPGPRDRFDPRQTITLYDQTACTQDNMTVGLTIGITPSQPDLDAAGISAGQAQAEIAATFASEFERIALLKNSEDFRNDNTAHSTLFSVVIATIDAMHDKGISVAITSPRVSYIRQGCATGFGGQSPALLP